MLALTENTSMKIAERGKMSVAKARWILTDKKALMPCEVADLIINRNHMSAQAFADSIKPCYSQHQQDSIKTFRLR